MENNEINPPQRDPALWGLAKKRYGFKANLASYIVVNGFLWILYFMTSNNHMWGHHNMGMDQMDDDIIPWPVWSTFGWGIGLVFHYISAYVTPKNMSIEKEYEKLLKKKEK